MKGKLKKQKRKIILKISAIMLVVFIVVSVVFSAITLSMEKQTQIAVAHNDYDYLVEASTGMRVAPYNEICLYAQAVKEHWRELNTGDLEFEKTCGADGTLDKNIQIVMYEHSDKRMLMNTDEEIRLAFWPDDFNTNTFDSGILNYNDFIQSINEEDLAVIRDYLRIKKDKEGYYYALICTSTYYNPENGHVYPKTVEIRKVKYEDSVIYDEEFKKTFELNPEYTDESNLYITDEMYDFSPCIINGQFVCNDFSSGNLIEAPFDPIDYTKLDPATGIIDKTGLFSYLYTNGGDYSVTTTDFVRSEHAIAYEEDMENFYKESTNKDYSDNEQQNQDTEQYVNSLSYLNQVIGIKYAKRINLLEYCTDTLIIGISSIFLFFLLITLILTIMMCKMMKTQLVEEEKRSELTNALAHDIKTPLFIISGYAQNLKENVNSDKRDHYCDRIIDKTQEVNSLVHKMLELSRPDDFSKALVFEDININKTVEDILSDFETLPDGKSFKLNSNEKCNINADKGLIERTLVNLISNAVTYSDINSEITVDISKNAFSISNKCTDISQSDIKHLTQPYYRVDKSRNAKGNGLGLSIVKTIADAHRYKLNIKLCDDIITFTLVFHK